MSDLPDLELVRRFGNEDLLQDKLAGGKGQLAARLAASFLAFGRGQQGQDDAHRQEAEAQQMNLAFSELQHAQMGSVEEGARYSRPPFILPAPVPGLQRWDGSDVPVGMDMGMVRLASAGMALGKSMAKHGGIGSVLMDAGKQLLGGAAQGALKGAIKPPAVPGVGSTLGGIGQDLAGRAKSFVQDKLPGMWQQSGINTLAGAKRTAMGLGLGAAGLYAAGKGLGAVKNYMSKEPGSAQFGSQDFGGSRVAYGANEYGQPDFRTPFG